MVMANNASGGKSKKAPIKVKQDMIDFIKTQGMTKALKRAGEISAKGTKGEAEFLEGVRRMYGANRLSAATKAATPTPMKKGSYQAGSAKSGKATYTTGSGVNYKGAATKPAAKPASKSMSGTTKRNLIGGALLAGGLIAAKATPAGRAASAAVGLGKAVAGTTGRKTVAKAATKATTKAVSQSRMESLSAAASGQKAAAAGRAVTPEQFSAMSSVAKATKKAPAKKAAPKKTAASAPKMSRWDANAPKPKAPKPTKK